MPKGPAFKFVLDAGPRDRTHVPVTMPLPADFPDGPAAVEPGRMPAQAVAGTLFLLAGPLKAGKKARLHTRPGGGTNGVALEEAPDVLSFREGSELVTQYHYGERSPLKIPAKPFFHPLNLGGVGLTRPVAARGESEEGLDHPHHRSLWVAHGNVNGADIWLDRVYKEWNNEYGFQRHRSFRWKTAGPACAGFAAVLEWQSAAGKPLLEEERTFIVWKSRPGARLIDLTVVLRAAHGEVMLGDTKEGGICALRIRDELRGDETGLITNALGARGEAENWGHRAPWCDCSGRIGKRPFGIAVLDHPSSFRFPTNWHVRDYGMFTANPFGWHDFGTMWSQDGSHVIPANGSIAFRYRIFLHKGDAAAARVADCWLDFAHPPRPETSKS